MPRVKSNDYKRNVAVFDAEFNRVIKKIEGTFNPADSYAKALEMFGNDETKILEALNNQLKAEAIEAKIAAETAGSLDEKAVLAFIKTFRSVPPFNDANLIGTDKKGNIDEEKQTKAILDQVRTVPFLMESMKAFVASRAEEDSSDSE